MSITSNLVETISGVLVERKNCVKIGVEYYEKNVDCVQIEDRWYRKSNVRIYFNEAEKQWMRKTENTTTGICNFHEHDFSYTFGMFEKQFENDFPLYTARGEYSVCNKEVFDSIPKVWSNNGGRYYDKLTAARNNINVKKDSPGNKYIYDFERLYNSESLIPLFSKVNNSLYTKDLLKSKKKFELINKYSFGLEFETAAGVIPRHLCKQFGMIPLRDGSIGGHEYTTIPMVGEDGVNLLMNQLEILNKYCYFDKECSLHVHFGNFNINEGNIVKLFNLCYALQDEIGDMFPLYIYNTGAYKSSGKDYCKKLPCQLRKIDELYSHLSEGASWAGDFTQPHPSDPRRDRKWDNAKRYYFCNFINALFGDSPKTIEFRLHTPTFNYSKVVNWLFICSAILNYAEKVESPKYFYGDNFTLKSVIDFSYDKETADILNNYILDRKKYFTKCYSVYGDNYGSMDAIEDMELTYNTPYGK